MGFLKGIMFATLTIFGFVAFGQDAVLPPESLEQAIAFLPTLISAAGHAQWLLFGAGVSLILTWLFKAYALPKLGLGTGVLPIVSALVGIFAGVGGAIYAGSSADAAMLAVLSGPLSSHLWDAMFKYFFAKK